MSDALRKIEDCRDYDWAVGNIKTGEFLAEEAQGTKPSIITFLSRAEARVESRGLGRGFCPVKIVTINEVAHA